MIRLHNYLFCFFFLKDGKILSNPEMPPRQQKIIFSSQFKIAKTILNCDEKQLPTSQPR